MAWTRTPAKSSTLAQRTGWQIVTSGGRVPAPQHWATRLREAQASAYRAVKAIHWDNAYYRSDIGFSGHRMTVGLSGQHRSASFGLRASIGL